MKLEIESVRFVSSGHYRVTAYKYNYSRTYPIRMTSITRYEYLCTDMTTIDDYHSDDDRRNRRGERELIRLCKWWGDKSNEKL